MRPQPALRYAAFLRAVNVAGHAVVRMADLKAAFEEAGCLSVRTVIQSGNVLFEAPESGTSDLFDAVHRSLRDSLGLKTTVVFRALAHLQKLVKERPFGGTEAGPDVKLYVSFLAAAPTEKPALPVLAPKEGLEVVGLSGLDVFLVSRRIKGRFGFPNNLVEKVLRVPATTRNWSTVTKIASL